ncbi:MAG: iron ABC transporter substrate-binding protein [Aminivibrio sp.]|jgi:iron complex transport system substrate-binding protein
MKRFLSVLTIFAALCLFALPAAAAQMTVTDSLGRSVTIPASPERIIGSGSGALRLITYLQARDRVVAVDSAEQRVPALGVLSSTRPYSIANPQFQDLPVFGEFRGHDNPELIAGLDPRPQVILKVSPLAGPHPDQLTEKTGIPVVGFEYGNLSDKKEEFYGTLRLMGAILGKEERAEALVAFFEGHLAELARRTADIPEDKRPSCYIGGVASRGAHGFTSTEPGYPPFLYTSARNVADIKGEKASAVTQVSKEKLLEWNPDIIFVDISTATAKDEASALNQLASDPALASLTAVKEGKIWSVLPYNSYTINYGSVLANGYFVGKVLYPDRFEDVDPAAKADEIYTFLVGKPVFAEMNEGFSGKVFAPLTPGK